MIKTQEKLSRKMPTSEQQLLDNTLVLLRNLCEAGVDFTSEYGALSFDTFVNILNVWLQGDHISYVRAVQHLQRREVYGRIPLHSSVDNGILWQSLQQFSCDVQLMDKYMVSSIVFGAPTLDVSQILFMLRELLFDPLTAFWGQNVCNGEMLKVIYYQF